MNVEQGRGTALMRAQMERNLRLLPANTALGAWLPWLPILVLFTRGEFGIDGALQLASVFYLAAVVAEVPSGWMSDRLGRVVTLRAATVLWVIGNALFVVSDGSFATVAAAEAMLALGFAAVSGTDVSLHYDTLEALGREDEYEPRQAKLSSFAFLSLAASAVAGGALGLWDLRLAFAMSGLVALVQFGVSFLLVEPEPATDAPAAGFMEQLVACRRYLDAPLLRWILGYWVAMVVLEHVAYTVAQPYLTEVLGRPVEDLGATPIISGLQFAGFSVIGALAASRASSWRVRYGQAAVLMAVAVLSASIIAAMALVFHAVVAVLILLRSVQGAVAPVILSAAIAPLVEQRHRATYLSLHSLAGRFAYGGFLYATALAVGDDLTKTLLAFAVVSWLLVVAVMVGWFFTRSALAGEVDPSPLAG